jgi:hypothetical protein
MLVPKKRKPHDGLIARILRNSGLGARRSGCLRFLPLPRPLRLPSGRGNSWREGSHNQSAAGRHSVRS